MRVPAKPLSSYPFYLQPFFANQRRKYGEVLQAALLWARSPKLFSAVAFLYGMIDRRLILPCAPSSPFAYPRSTRARFVSTSTRQRS